MNSCSRLILPTHHRSDPLDLERPEDENEEGAQDCFRHLRCPLPQRGGRVIICEPRSWGLCGFGLRRTQECPHIMQCHVDFLRPIRTSVHKDTHRPQHLGHSLVAILAFPKRSISIGVRAACLRLTNYDLRKLSDLSNRDFKLIVKPAYFFVRDCQTMFSTLNPF